MSGLRRSACFDFQLLEERRQLGSRAERLTEARGEIEELALEDVGLVAVAVNGLAALLAFVVELLFRLRERAAELADLKVEIVRDALGSLRRRLRATLLAAVGVPLVDGVGHFLHLEQPELVNARIIEFLK